MPADEIDPDDPMMLVGVGLPVEEADDQEMVLALVDEFVRMGFSQADIFRLFADPYYSMTHGILIAKGEKYVRDCIGRVMDRWAAGACPGPVGAPACENGPTRGGGRSCPR